MRIDRKSGGGVHQMFIPHARDRLLGYRLLFSSGLAGMRGIDLFR